MKRAFHFLFVLTGLTVLFTAAGLCRADGFIVIHNPPEMRVPGHFAFAPLEVAYHHVTVDINDQIATTTVNQEFYNPNPQVLEGTYLFPLPAGSHIDKFSMDINGTMMEAELLGADKARALYEDIVRKYRDPALLEYMGRDAFKVHIFPIAGNSRKKIKLTYTQLLKADAGLVEYDYPMNTEKFSARPLGNVSVKCTLSSKDPIKSIYSPSNNVDIRREGDKHAVVGWEQNNVRPDTDFRLIFSRSKQAVGVDLLTYRQSGDDGYFMLLASPGLEAPKGAVQKKDLCFILDVSGSMAGAKIEQARKALSFCLNNLEESDRFEVISFSTECQPFFGELRPASKANVDKALTMVKDLRAIGGTAISDALHQALSMKHDVERPYEVVFLTDGEPTIGETNEDVLVSQAVKDGGGNTRIFCFGIGNDVNTHLLDRIAGDTRAFSTYVAPEEDIEIKVSSFYTRIKEPVLSNVQLAFTGDNVRTMQLYPSVMPDLFKGEMLVAFGRYSGKGAAAVKITGTISGQPQTFVTDVSFCENDTTNAYIPRLWATRRVGYLLDQIRMHGESQELRDEVTRLAREHGIVTPYTAFLILEDERRRNVPISMQTMRELGADDRVRKDAQERLEQTTAEAANPSARTGGKAVASARDVDELKNMQSLDRNIQLGSGGGGSGGGQWNSLDKGGAMDSPVPPPPPPVTVPPPSNPNYAAGAPASRAGAQRAQGQQAPGNYANFGYRVAQNYTQQARVLNGRAFYQNGTIWTDATAQRQQNLKQKKIAFNSDEYFDLLKNHAEARPWLALGTEVDVVIGDTLYMVR